MDLDKDKQIEETPEEVTDRGSETAENDKPQSVRDSIRSALKEHAEDDADDKEIKNVPEKKKPVKASEKDDNDEEDAGDDDTSTEKDKKEPVVKEPKDTTEKVETVEKKEKTPAPASLPKEVTADWDKLPSSAQTYLTRVQKDLTDTKSMLGRIQAQSRDMDQVIAQYKPSIDQLGVTPAQTVDRLFQWMNGLSGPHKVSVARQLLQNFGIDLNQQQQQDTQDNQQQQQQQAYIPPEVSENLSALTNEVTALKQQQQQQRERAAAETVNSWAGLQPDGTYKNKPHYEKVRQSMFSLMASGAVPMIKDGYGNDRLDLDGAYEAACYANAEVRASLEQEKQEQLKEQQKKDAEAKKQREKEKVEAAKKASGSIKPGAPANTPNSNPAPRKNANGTVSVRDSIKHAFREVANN